MQTVNGVPFRKNMLSPSKYSRKSPYAMTPKKITLHNTDNQMAADNEIRYMISNNNATSYHVAIDEKEAIQAVPYDRNAFAAGDGANGYGNRNTIHIEICRNYDRTRRTTNLNDPLRGQYSQAEANTVKFVAQLCVDLGIVANNDNIKTHNDWSGKNCPSKIRNEGRTQAVKNAIIAEYKRLTTTPKKQDDTLYRVQAGAFGSVENAKRLEKQMKDKGFATYMVEADALHKVQVGAFGLKDNADAMLKRVKDAGFDGFITTEGAAAAAPEPKPVAKPAPKPVAKPAPAPKPQLLSLNAIAKDVIDNPSKWGSGQARTANLTKAGYNAAQVQAKINELLKPAPRVPQLTLDGSWGESTMKRLQEVLGTPATGLIGGQSRNAVTENMHCVRFGTGGSSAIMAMQRRLRVKVDGYMGVQTMRALQKHLGTPQTGGLSKTGSTAVIALQKRLNNNTF